MAKQEHSFGIIPLEEIKDEWQVFLVQHRDGQHWSFPKGHRNENESGKDAAIRELLEETGLDIQQFLCEEPLEEKYQCEKNGEKIDKTVFYYPAIVRGVAVLQHDEIMMGQWFSLEEAKKEITFEESRNILNQVQKVLEGKGCP